jgi:hypothetical protein
MKLDADRLWTADETAFYLGVPKAQGHEVKASPLVARDDHNLMDRQVRKRSSR